MPITRMVGHEQPSGLHGRLRTLTTNAVKYDALRAGNGYLAVKWRIKDSDRQTPFLDWKESGLATLSEPARRGHGWQLIGKAPVVSLRAETELDFEPDGVLWRIEIPLVKKP